MDNEQTFTETFTAMELEILEDALRAWKSLVDNQNTYHGWGRAEKAFYERFVVDED